MSLFRDPDGPPMRESAANVPIGIGDAVVKPWDVTAVVRYGGKGDMAKLYLIPPYSRTVGERG